MTADPVYIKCGVDYKIYFRKLDFDSLIELVRVENNLACKGDTMVYIARKATAFVQQIKETQGTENMKQKVSLRQISKLIRFFKCKKIHISCHSLIILHTIYEAIKHSQDKESEIMEFVTVLYTLADKYLEGHSDNCFAQYIVDTYGPVRRALAEKTAYKPADFPRVHRKNPKL